MNETNIRIGGLNSTTLLPSALEIYKCLWGVGDIGTVMGHVWYGYLRGGSFQAPFESVTVFW